MVLTKSFASPTKESTALVFDAHVQCLDYRDAYTFIGVAKHSGKRHISKFCRVFAIKSRFVPRRDIAARDRRVAVECTPSTKVRENRTECGEEGKGGGFPFARTRKIRNSRESRNVGSRGKRGRLKATEGREREILFIII